MNEVQRAYSTLVTKTLLGMGGQISSDIVSITLPGVILTMKFSNAGVLIWCADKQFSISAADPNIEKHLDAILKDARESTQTALAYARRVGPSEEVETLLATDARRAYWYAYDVLKGPFPAGEAAIAKDAEYAYEYALRVLKLPATEAKDWGMNGPAQKGKV